MITKITIAIMKTPVSEWSALTLGDGPSSLANHVCIAIVGAGAVSQEMIDMLVSHSGKVTNPDNYLGTDAYLAKANEDGYLHIARGFLSLLEPVADPTLLESAADSD